MRRRRGRDVLVSYFRGAASAVPSDASSKERIELALAMILHQQALSSGFSYCASFHAVRFDASSKCDVFSSRCSQCPLASPRCVNNHRLLNKCRCPLPLPKLQNLASPYEGAIVWRTAAGFVNGWFDDSMVKLSCWRLVCNRAPESVHDMGDSARYGTPSILLPDA